jgi:hypothetical protein
MDWLLLPNKAGRVAGGLTGSGIDVDGKGKKVVL